MSDENNTSLRMIKALRVIFALLIPAPIILFYSIWHSINLTYHPKTYQADQFWLNSLIEIVPVIALAAFTAFWRFQSAKVGKWMLAVQVALGLFLFGLAYTVL